MSIADVVPAAAPYAGTGDGSTLIRYGGGPIYSQTIIRLRAERLRDLDGTLTAQRDWPAAQSAVFAGVSVQPDATSETRDAAGVLVTDQWRIFGPRGVNLDLVNGDRVLWDGRTLDVVGAPQTWPGLLAGWHHSEIVVKQSPFTRLDATGAPATTADAELGAIAGQHTYTP